eukprot:CAMPEP_0177651348 /NCGR_PEP_ID=MMETSP0447-20121125/12494_1 /TAXON_ID=0 /ORGANISM="Stygamoeba regulata, Strain BSH-02190019" /LENGTH=336 /DNA_ID=CAMNT_0019154411 /DNA_START=51 /DNA_END=1061 /DNA_ORIENTATION=-
MSTESFDAIQTDSQVDYEGVLKKREGDKEKKGGLTTSWSPKYFILTGSTLYLYTSQLKAEPKSSLNIKDAQIITTDVSKDKKNAFAIKQGDIYWAFQASSKDEMDKWVKLLQANLKKEPGEQPKRVLGKKEGSVFFRGTKNLVDSVGSSSLGRKLIKQFSPEADAILSDVEKFIEMASGKERSKEIVTKVIKLAAKASSLHQGKIVKGEEFEALKLPILRVWNTFSDCESSFSRDLPLLSRQIKDLHTHLDKMLRPHLTPKSMNSMRDIVDYFTDLSTLEKLFAEEKKYQDLTEGIFSTLKKAWEGLSPSDKKIILDDCLAQTAENAPKKMEWSDV